MFDGSSWSLRDTISLNMPGSYYYNLEINDNNEIIATWDWGQPYYRIYTSGAWGDIKNAYNDNNDRVFRNTSIDNNSVIHAATSFYYSGENMTYDRIGISKYNFTTDVWDSTIIISERRVTDGYAVFCDNSNKTHLAYSQYVDTLTKHFNYYAFDNGNGFQFHQFLSDEMGSAHNIIIDQNVSVHICYTLYPEFDKDENKHFTKLIH